MNINRRDMFKMLGAMMLISPMSSLLSFNNSVISQYNELVNKATIKGWLGLPKNKLMEKIAFEFIDTPYIGGTLDTCDVEQCTVELDKLDCVTYFETVLAIATCLKDGKFEYEDLVHQVQQTRYRNGVIKDYTSRLHYTADWIYENVKNGVFKDITKDIGGEVIKFNTYFMSKNPDKYNALKANPQFVPIIRKQEEKINDRKYYYLPKEKTHRKIEGIETCDIIALTTSIGGLDYSHIGFAYKNDDGEIHFLHASSAKKKVVLDTQLSEYLAGKKFDTGITVLRAL